MIHGNRGSKNNITNKKQKRELQQRKNNKGKQQVINEPKPVIKSERIKEPVKISNLILGGGGTLIKKLDIIITCVNYSDFLVLTLKENIKYGFPITVITSERDKLTQKLCEEFEVNCVVTEAFYEDGAVFNKGKAINVGINSLDNPEWILHLDADIILLDDFRDIILNKSLSINKMYSATRYMCYTYDKFDNYQKGLIKINQMDAVHTCPPVGYFQLFNYNHSNLKNKSKIYPEVSKDASWSDLLFADMFPEKECLKNIRTIHLGYDGRNWKGRKTERFINEIKFFETLDSDVPKFIRHPEIPEKLRDKSIIPKLAVVTSYFNPENYQNIKNNYRRFSTGLKGVVDLFTIELSYTDEFMLPENEFNIRIRGNKQDHIMWQKEKLLNLLISKLPKEYTNVAWVDCDILFDNPKWTIETNEKLKYYPVVQIYEVANRMNENEEIERQSVGIAKYNSKLIEKENNFNNGIPGFGWAARREFIEEFKLFEYNILGGGDSMMCYSFYGKHRDNFLVSQMNDKWKNLFINWGDKVFEHVKSSVGYVCGNITHLYHGSHQNRKYNDRFYYLSDFDPLSDIITDENGIWKWSTNKNKMIQTVKNYFSERQEDEKIIELIDINKYFDQIYVLNLDRQPEKFEKIKKKLDDLGIKFTRFSGVDGNSDEILSEWNEVKKTFEFKPGLGLLENQYAYGCLLSHKKIIEDAKKNKYNKILVLEDDVLFHKNFLNEIQKLKKIPKTWKLLYFGTSQYDWNVVKFFSEDFYYSNKSLGTFAYGIDSSIYDEILKTIIKPIKTIDNYLGVEIQQKNQNNCFVIYPNIIIADVVSSNIRETRDQNTHSQKMKWVLKNF